MPDKSQYLVINVLQYYFISENLYVILLNDNYSVKSMKTELIYNES